MKLSTAKAPEAKSILLIGPPGGGKTSFALQFPSPVINDCDRNLDGPMSYLNKRIKDHSFFYETISFDDNLVPVPIATIWDRLRSKVREQLKNPDIKTIIVDSLTHVDEYLVQWVLARQRKTEMDQRDWMPFRSELASFIMEIRSQHKTAIITCHETYTKNREGFVIKTQPAMRSHVKDFFGSFFTDIYRPTIEVVGGKPVAKLQVLSDALNDLKNTFGITQAQIDQDSKTGLLFTTYNTYAKLS
jgi:hypothetical protein